MAHLLHLLLFLSFPVSLLAAGIPGFWSIDCGGSENFTDTRGIEWVGDEGYVRTGESVVVTTNSTSYIREMQTLRVFKSKRKNCYTIPIGEGIKVLIRAMFYYGNYDKLSNPPEFLLQIDSNDWSWVIMTMDVVSIFELVYITKKETTDICLGMADSGQFPFVNSIEVRTLKPSVYRYMDSNHALLMRSTTAYGAVNYTISYPNDAYDRIWFSNKEGYTVLKNDAPFVNTSSSDDDPPELAFQTAVAPNGTTNLTIHTPYLPSYPVQIYFNMYFSEMRSNLTNSTRKRSFNIYMDNNLLTKEPVVPPYGEVLELTRPNLNASNSTVFFLAPISNLSLPPIISAKEVLEISSELNNGTDINDVQSLTPLLNRFKVLQEWTGDPCLPLQYNWEWVGCNSDVPPRITALLLSGYGLSGTLPNFGGLEALEIIDLHNNSLKGDIPEFLGNLPNLTELNLADNDFSHIPASLKGNTKINLDVSGNPELSPSHPPSPPPRARASPPSPSKSSNKLKSSSMVSFYFIILLAFVGLV